MLRVILVDDEPLARQRLRQLLAAESDVEIVGEAGTAVAALELIREEKPDAAFVDVRMPGMSGLQLAEACRRSTKVIFVTAYAAHAVEAFEVDAVDFLLKPVRAARLAESLRRIRGISSTPSITDRLCLHTGQKTHVVPVDAIRLLEADGDFTRIHIAGAPSLFICHPLGYYEALLPNPPFVRLDRSIILHSGCVAEVHGNEGDTRVRLEGLDVEIEIGRTARRRLARILTT
ncbi:MAG: response regulator transcription factor [Terrimicrobiaceae bacterium]|nr:response regulator transcription factor [Terrimicrobiaceae bacterium]